MTTEQIQPVPDVDVITDFTEIWKNYKVQALRTAKRFEDPMLDYAHPVMGLIGEIGELVDAIKKHVIYNKPLDMTNLREELGDIFWYQALLEKVIGLTPKSITITSISIESDGFEVYAASIAIYTTLMARLTSDQAYQDTSIFGSVFSAAGIICSLHKFDPEEILNENIAKLKKRYPEKYTDEAAIARADKAMDKPEPETELP